MSEAHRDYDEAGEISPIKLIAAVMRRRTLIVVLAGLGLVAAILTRFLVLDDWVADARFRPQAGSPSGGGGLAGVAASFGIDVGAGSEGSPQFYSALIGSRDVLRRAVTTEYVFAVGGRDSLRGNLVKFLKPKGETPEGRTRSAMAMLKSRITTPVDITTGLVTLRVEMPYAALAEKVNRRMLNLLGEYNVAVRQSNATAEKKFVETQLQDARTRLRAAQSDLQAFLTANAQPIVAPRLQVEMGRLQSEVALRQSLYTTLATSYEQSRIQEVRDTPVITVVEQPEASARPSYPVWWIFGLFGAFAGIVLGLAIGLAAEYLQQRRRKNPAEFVELSDVMGQTTSQMRSLGRVFQRQRPPSAPPSAPR
jgi:uncharacterized protein involved in exopolysaccharide biosynthesis